MTATGEFELEPSRSTHRIVVGIDGSGGGERALEWAIRQAQRNGAVLDVVTAWMLPALVGYSFVPLDDGARRWAHNLVDRALSFVAQVAPDVVVRGEAVEQTPGPALVSASKGADLMVVGSRGIGGFKELLLGSVGHFCLRHASCPVVVVR